MPTLPSTYTTRRRDHIVVAPAFPDGEEALRESPTPDPDLDDCVQVPGDTLGAVTEVSFLIFHSLTKANHYQFCHLQGH